MANKVLTIVFDTIEQSVDAVIAAAIDELHKAGNTIKEIRLADDSGEVKVEKNTVEGVTVPEPVTDAPAPEPEPVPEDAPVDPTEVSSEESSSTDS